jgi:hypothetical protein
MPFSATDPWLLAFLKRVRTRPGMYLGDENVKTLATFVQAYAQARADLGVSEFASSESSVLPDFEKWLAGELGDSRDVAWYTLIASEDPSDRNVHTFFRRFEEFLLRQGESLERPVSVEWPPSSGSGD